MAQRLFTFDEARSPLLSTERSWPEKSAKEALLFTLSIDPWLDVLTSKYGKIVEMTVLDEGDDPPDITVRFEQGTVGFEMTKMLPQKFGYFDSVIENDRTLPFKIAPTLSGLEFKSKKQVIDYASNRSGFGGWETSSERLELWINEATNMFMKKVGRTRTVGFEYVVMFAQGPYLNCHEAIDVIEALNQIIQTEIGVFPSLIVILWDSPYNYESWLMVRNEETKYIKRSFDSAETSSACSG
jgi:hypothetical protein